MNNAKNWIVSVLLVVGASIEARGQSVATDDTMAAAAPLFDTGGPQDLPGEVKGPRDRVQPPQPQPRPEEKPDWFGGKPWLEWSHLTGNWGGTRTTLEDKGLTINGSFALTWTGVWDGGLRNVASTRRMTDLNASFDLDKTAGLKGGTVYADFYSTRGNGGTNDAADFAGIDNTQSPHHVDELAQLWYEQKLFDNLLRFKIGKIDGNSEFGFLSAAADFLNSSVAMDATQYPVLPAFPDPASGAVAFVYPTQHLYAGAAVFDGASNEGIRLEAQGPATFFSDRRSDSWFTVGEAGATWECECCGCGRAAVGGWWHSGRFARFDGSGNQGGMGGLDILGEQQVWRRGAGDDEKGKGLFVCARFGHGDEEVNAAANTCVCGISMKGTCSARPDDGAGAMASWVGLSRATGSGFSRDETTIEVYYKVQLTPFVAITPDLQYVVNPSGSATVGNALVGGVRVVVSF